MKYIDNHSTRHPSPLRRTSHTIRRVETMITSVAFGDNSAFNEGRGAIFYHKNAIKTSEIIRRRCGNGRRNEKFIKFSIRHK